MESQNALGLYFGKTQATAVCVNKGAVVGTVALSLEANQKGDLQTLAHWIAEQCKELNFKYTEVSVALDSAWFMQHSVRSEFTQARQIGATVRFDTEEVVASDISNLAVAFEITKSDDHGSALNVFTADHSSLSQILLTLQSHALDPIRILPDIGCLTDLVQKNLDTDVQSGHCVLICLISQTNGYFLKYDPATGVHPVRAFLLGSHTHITEVLVRESFTTMASVGSNQGSLFVYSTNGQVETDVLSQRLGVPVAQLPWFESSPWGQQALSDEQDVVAYAVAYGAATLSVDAGLTLDFRRDFMPYQGKKMRFQSAMKWACISATLLILAWGGRLQANWFQAKSDCNALKDSLRDDYTRVMPGKKDLPKNPVRELERAIREIKNVQGGRLDLGGNQSTLAKLTLVLKAINQCYQPTGLEIDRVNIALATISISGTAASTAGRLQFQNALKDQNIGDITMQGGSEKNGRAPFSISIKTQASRGND
ncbi:MAG: hypothetical protein K9N55_06285 [Phycisphaerae bacterium]|nr:hypothetical protein [Phycisphaerae bacterium]